MRSRLQQDALHSIAAATSRPAPCSFENASCQDLLSFLDIPNVPSRHSGTIANLPSNLSSVQFPATAPTCSPEIASSLLSFLDIPVNDVNNASSSSSMPFPNAELPSPCRSSSILLPCHWHVTKIDGEVHICELGKTSSGSTTVTSSVIIYPDNVWKVFIHDMEVPAKCPLLASFPRNAPPFQVSTLCHLLCLKLAMLVMIALISSSSKICRVSCISVQWVVGILDVTNAVHACCRTWLFRNL